MYMQASILPYQQFLLCVCVTMYMHSCMYIFTCVHIHMCTCSCVYIFTCVHVHVCTYSLTRIQSFIVSYGVATISRLLKIAGLFCRISSLLWGSFAIETYNFKEPTNRSHSMSSLSYPISNFFSVCVHVYIHSCVHIRMCVYIRMCTYSCVHIIMCAHMYTHYCVLCYQHFLL